MQLIILGMHRSGTSMVTRLVNMMGAYFGPEKASLGFNKDNPKGFWERKDVMALNDALLAQQQCGWDRISGWNPQPESPLRESAPQLFHAMKSLILDLDAHRPWVMKDPRLCLTLPLWKPLLEVPVAVVVYRDPLEVAKSLEIRNRFPLAFGLALWEAYAVHLLNASLGMPRVFVRHAECLSEPVRAAAKLHAQLKANDVQGLRLPSAREITAFVEPKLYRSKTEGMQRLLSPDQERLARLLSGEEQQQEALMLSPACRAALARG